jgi:hypothetical protein
MWNGLLSKRKGPQTQHRPRIELATLAKCAEAEVHHRAPRIRSAAVTLRVPCDGYATRSSIVQGLESNRGDLC